VKLAVFMSIAFIRQNATPTHDDVMSLAGINPARLMQINAAFSCSSVIVCGIAAQAEEVSAPERSSCFYNFI